MSLLVYGCAEKSEQSPTLELGIVSLPNTESPDITQVLNRVEVQSWKLNYQTDSIYLMIYNPEKDTNALKAKHSASISMYDMYLSTNALEAEKYSILNIKADGVDGRIVSRSYSDSTNYIEVYFKAVCPAKYQVLIQGSNLTAQHFKMVEQLHKEISFRCSK